MDKRTEKQKWVDWLDDFSGRSAHFLGESRFSGVICIACGNELTVEENNDSCDLPIKERKCEKCYMAI